MPQQDHLPFRTGTVLATVFTGTLSERYGDPIERIPTPARLLDWLAANRLPVRSCSTAQLERARTVREAIHEAATAAATGQPLPPDAVDTLNQAARDGHWRPRLTAGGEHAWQLGTGRSARVEDALAVIAADAITMVSVDRDRLATCSSPTCRAVFVDASQSRSRRWCDMNTCGNRQKKARFRHREQPPSERRAHP